MPEQIEVPPGTLKEGEPHPAAESAIGFIKCINFEDLAKYQEAFASTAISGNRVGEVCAETLRRVLAGEPVSDRYLLGLAWIIMEMVLQNQLVNAQEEAKKPKLNLIMPKAPRLRP